MRLGGKIHSPIDGAGGERGVFENGVIGVRILREEGLDGAEGEGLGALLEMLAAGEDARAWPRAAACRSSMRVSLAPSMPWEEALVLLFSVQVSMDECKGWSGISSSSSSSSSVSLSVSVSSSSVASSLIGALKWRMVAEEEAVGVDPDAEDAVEVGDGGVGVGSLFVSVSVPEPEVDALSAGGLRMGMGISSCVQMIWRVSWRYCSAKIVGSISLVKFVNE